MKILEILGNPPWGPPKFTEILKFSWKLSEILGDYQKFSDSLGDPGKPSAFFVSDLFQKHQNLVKIVRNPGELSQILRNFGNPSMILGIPRNFANPPGFSGILKNLRKCSKSCENSRGFPANHEDSVEIHKILRSPQESLKILQNPRNSRSFKITGNPGKLWKSLGSGESSMIPGILRKMPGVSKILENHWNSHRCLTFFDLRSWSLNCDSFSPWIFQLPCYTLYT